MRPLVTIIICTYNRQSLLKRLLSALIQQQVTFFFDILVVDNNSTDATKEVVKEIALLSPVPLNYCLEKQQGIGHARNRGIKVARGKYIAYIDDDAFPDSQWLNNVFASFTTIEPAPSCVAGKVELVWEGQRVQWFPQEYETLLGKYDFGNESKYLGKDDYFVTMNVAFEKEIFLRIGGFKPFLGRKRGCFLSGEDNDMYDRLYKAGIKIYYNPRQLVYHFVPKKRQRFSWLLRRIFWDGASQPLMDLEEGFQNITLLRRILYDLRCALSCFLQGFYFLISISNRKKSLNVFLGGVQKLGRANTELKFIYHREYIQLWETRKISRRQTL